mgnify:CR=1 FL=1
MYKKLINKYRPKTINNLYYNELLINKLNNIYNDIDNIILLSESGCGKSSILNIIKKKYKKVLHLYNYNYRGYDIITRTINDFIKLQISDIKIIIIDNIDNISQKAQIIISDIINNSNSNNVKFIITGNNISNILETIQSKCIIINLIIEKDILFKHLKLICDNEKFNYNDEALLKLIDIYNHDIRKIINIIEIIIISFNNININNIYKLLNKLDTVVILKLFNNLVNNNIKDSIKIINNLLLKGYSKNDIVLTLIKEIEKYDIEENKKIDIINIINKKYITLNVVVNSNLQLYSCFAEICDYLN